jgi:hypothetical protein
VDAVIGNVGDAKVMRLRGVAVIDRIEFGAAIVFGAGALVAFGGSKGAAVVTMATRDRLRGFRSGWNGAST